MEIFLFVLYSLLAGFWILKSSFFKRFRLKRGFLLAVFALKLAAGVTYGLIYQYFYETGDIVHYFADSKVIYSALWQNPSHFLQMVFGYSSDGTVPQHLQYLDEQLRLRWRTQEYTMVRINALLNIFSFGHYYVNVVLMSLISLSGLAMLHEVFRRHAPTRGNLIAVVIFLLPATLFWCSGIHKDAVTLSCAAIALYCTNGLAFQFRWKRLLFLVLALFLLGITRSYALFLLLPNLLLYFICLLLPGKVLLRFAILNLLAFLLATQMGRFVSYDPMEKLVAERQFLMTLKGNTHLQMRPLAPDLSSLLSNLPQAFDHVWLKPFTYPPTHKLQWISAIDGFLQALFLLWLLWRIPWRKAEWDALSLCSLCFAFALLLLVGLTVPALGAIVRYKAVALPFLLAPLASKIDSNLEVRQWFSHQ